MSKFFLKNFFAIHPQKLKTSGISCISFLKANHNVCSVSCGINIIFAKLIYIFVLCKLNIVKYLIRFRQLVLFLLQ